MSHRLRLSAAIAFALFAATFSGRPAEARSERIASYPFEQAWPTAVRHLRVDENLKVIERDAEAGYVLFELEDSGKTFRGSLEVVRTVDAEERPAVRLILRIRDRPAYMEQGILDRLLRKLRHEHGEPAEPPAPDRDRGKRKPTAED